MALFVTNRPEPSIGVFADAIGHNVLEKFLGHDETNARFCATTTRVLAIIHEVVTVIKRQLLPCPDIAYRHQPNASIHKPRLAIRLATVIQESRRVPIDIAIQIVLVINRKNVFVTALATCERFLFGDDFPNVFDDPRAGWNIDPSEAAVAVDGELLNTTGSVLAIFTLRPFADEKNSC